MQPMRPPKRIRRQLRELASLAYERELNRELAALAVKFERWRRGELTPWDLSERIHAFHQDLFVLYRDLDEGMAVGRALAGGTLEEKEIPVEVLAHAPWPPLNSAGPTGTTLVTRLTRRGVPTTTLNRVHPVEFILSRAVLMC